jgi:hypothetical protein
MTTSIFPSFVIRVLVVGRDKPIESHAFKTRAEAEVDLTKIMDAQQGSGFVELSWLTMPGTEVQAAHVVDRTTSVSVPTVAQRPRTDPFDPFRRF